MLGAKMGIGRRAGAKWRFGRRGRDRGSNEEVAQKSHRQIIVVPKI